MGIYRGELLWKIDLIDRICDYIKIRMFEMNHPWSILIE